MKQEISVWVIADTDDGDSYARLFASMASILTGHGLDGRKCGMNVEAIDDEDVEVPVDDEAA